MEDPIICFGAFFFGLAMGLVSTKPNIAPSPQVNAQVPAKKRKRHRKRQSVLISPPPLVLDGPSSYDVQKEEMEALAAIYEEDLIILKPLTEKSEASYKIFLRPNLRSSQDTFCSVYLLVKYSNKYPQIAPEIDLINSVNIPNEVIRRTKEQSIVLANEKAKVNEPMIYSICELIQSELLNQNSLPITIQPFIEESKVNRDSNLMDEIYEELKKKRKRKDYEEPMQLNTMIDIKEIDRQLDIDLEPSDCHAISGFDYKRYFDEEIRIGQGGGGSVYKARNKIDKCFYAIKKIRLKGKKKSYINYILKEVLLLSRLQHQHIVRYHNAWFEEETDSDQEDDSSESEESNESESSSSEVSSESSSSEDKNWIIGFERSSGHVEPVIWQNGGDVTSNASKLYIQMEYCAGDTLRSVLDERPASNTENYKIRAAENWKMFREILQGLVYLHSKDMIHRDLKPSNIFLDGNGEVKLGDFGLATTTNLKQEKKESKNKSGTENFSAGVGTPLYCSPEQLKSGNYDQKSDMYSLGLIFYEMWRNFGSMMQRIDELNQLKLEKDRFLPEDFVKTVPPEIVSIIMWLTEFEPVKRPTAQELLQSGLLPHNIDKEAFEDFVRVSLNPNNTEYRMLLGSIFSKPNPNPIEYTYNMSDRLNEAPTTKRRKKKVEAMLRSNITGKIRRVLNKAGAVELDAPLISPFSGKISISSQDRKGVISKDPIDCHESIPKFMDQSGLIVQLNNNTVCPWARIISRKNLGGILKRYSITNIYRNHGEGEHPEQIAEASVDILYDPDTLGRYKYWFEAEIMKLTLLCIEQFNKELPLIEVAVSDSCILDSILDFCEISKNMRLKVLSTCANIKRRKWAKVKEDLVTLGIQPGTAEKLGFLFKMRGSRESIIEGLKRQPIWRDRILVKILDDEIKNLEEKSKDFGFSFVVDLGLIPDEILHYSGLLYNISSLQNIVKGNKMSKERVIIASGGRYDNLLSHYEYPENINKRKQGQICGLGSQIFIEKIFLILLQGDFDHLVKGPLIFVSCNSQLQKSSKIQDDNTHLNCEKISLILELWKKGLSAIYNYNDMSDEEIIDSCRRYRIRFWVSLEIAPQEESKDLIRAKVKDFGRAITDEFRKDRSDFGKETSRITTDKNGVLGFIQERIKKHSGDLAMTYPQSAKVIN